MSVQRAIIYARVSDIKQATEGDGLGSQETRCREYASAKGYDVAAAFPDTITGGIDFMKRPGMVALLAYLDAHPNENFVIIFDDPKRFARSTRFHIELREALRSRGAMIECLNFRFDDTSEGEFFETIVAAQGQLERKQNGRQSAQKMKARMQNGYWVHKAVVGYKYQQTRGRGKVLVPDAPLDGIIREAFEGFASGRFRTQAEVRRFFKSFPEFPRNRKGDITQERVHEIFQHPIYTGHICSDHCGIHWLKAPHEPLISVETFEKVQECKNGAAYAPRRQNIGDHFALRGVVACACCGVPFRSSFAKARNGTRHPYYLCQTKGCEVYGKSIRRDQLEGDIGEIIKTLEPTESLKTLATAMFRHLWEARRTQAKSIQKEAKAKLLGIDKQIEALVARIMSATSEAMVPIYEGEIVALERSKAVVAEQMQKQAEPAGSFEEKLEPALTFLASPWKLWETGCIHLRRTVLKLAFTDHIQYCRNKGARTADLALLFQVLEGLEGHDFVNGAQERTRTSTSIQTPAPEAGASTNSATWAGVVSRAFKGGSCQCQTDSTCKLCSC